MDMYIIDGEVVDTYGGDYTYRYVYAEDDETSKTGVSFYEYCTGAKEQDAFLVDDPDDITLYMEIYNQKS
jgi:hypothetical protein